MEREFSDGSLLSPLFETEQFNIWYELIFPIILLVCIIIIHIYLIWSLQHKVNLMKSPQF